MTATATENSLRTTVTQLWGRVRASRAGEASHAARCNQPKRINGVLEALMNYTVVANGEAIAITSN